MTSKFEEVIRQLTKPINDQFPRPWMTKMTNPAEADLFIVGRNQKNGYPVESVGSQERHLDALFNRNGMSCRSLYDEITGGNPSPTRVNTERFSSLLEERGISRILETNVICYSTPMSADLRLNEHIGGMERGEEVFRYLIGEINPSVLVVHGSGATKQLESILGERILPFPTSREDVCLVKVGSMFVAPIPSLAPPAHNKWSTWAWDYLETLSQKLVTIL